MRIYTYILALLACSSLYAHYPFTLPQLPYSYGALEPHIDMLTMTIHHDGHHQSYVDKLNAALKDYPELHTMSLEYLVKNWKKLPERVRRDVRNHGGGHLNHSQFWLWLSPVLTQPEGKLRAALIKKYGSFDAFKKAFNKKAFVIFGGGWAWLGVVAQGELDIVTTANQDNPISDGKKPLLGLDVWEHAYYLKHRNNRSSYFDDWWQVVNWPRVQELFDHV